MAEDFTRWESDPLFSAAEVVQDSADRMEAVYRLLLHEHILLQGDTTDTKLLSSIQCHKRDLVTALETTKWQLEDFERAVHLAALSDKSHSRENAISRHKQFIRAIREQIVLLEKSLDEISIGDSNRYMQWTNLNEPDTVGLELFLSGGDSMDHHHIHYNSESCIMKRFLDSTADSDGIVELKPKEIEHLLVNDMSHLDHTFDCSKDNKLRKLVSHYSEGSGLEPSVFPQGSTLEKECEGSDNSGTCSSEVRNCDAKYLSYKNRLHRFLLKLLNNFWFANKCRMTQNFIKRRKDGELTDDFIVDIDGRKSHSILAISPAEQGKQTWMGLSSNFGICQGLCFERLANALQICRWLEALRKRFQRFRYFIQYNQIPIRLASAILVTVVVLGLLLAFCIT